MRALLFLLCCVAWGGEGIDLLSVRTQSVTYPASVHTVPTIIELSLSDWTTCSGVPCVTPDDGVAELNAVGVQIDFQDATHMRIADLWKNGGSNCLVDLTLFQNSYLFLRWQRDQAGTLGTAQTDYCQAWDRFGVLQVNFSNAYTTDTGYNFGAIY